MLSIHILDFSGKSICFAILVASCFPDQLASKLRLSRDQQVSRYSNRCRMVLGPYDASKVPDEKCAPVRLALPAQEVSTPTPGSGPAPGAAPASMEEPEEDLDENALLGLDADEPGQKKRKSSTGGGGPRVKKSRADAFDEEYTKMEAKFEEILMSLRTSSPANAQAIRGLERTATKKIEDAKKAGLFDQASSTEELCAKCILVKEAIRVAGLYISASGLPNKKHEDAFMVGIQKLPKELRQRMSDSVQDHYLHLAHTKDRHYRAHDLHDVFINFIFLFFLAPWMRPECVCVCVQILHPMITPSGCA